MQKNIPKKKKENIFSSTFFLVGGGFKWKKGPGIPLHTAILYIVLMYNMLPITHEINVLFHISYWYLLRFYY